MKFFCPKCGKFVDVSKKEVVSYEMKGLVSATCPGCGNKGLIRWAKEREQEGYVQGELRGDK